jgi:hypothetical protein
MAEAIRDRQEIDRALEALRGGGVVSLDNPGGDIMGYCLFVPVNDAGKLDQNSGHLEEFDFLEYPSGLRGRIVAKERDTNYWYSNGAYEKATDYWFVPDGFRDSRNFHPIKDLSDSCSFPCVASHISSRSFVDYGTLGEPNERIYPFRLNMVRFDPGQDQGETWEIVTKALATKDGKAVKKEG